MNINADTAANIQNAGGVISLPADQVIAGDFTNTTGEATLNGQLNGDLRVEGGTVDTVSETVVSGATNLVGGTLEANGGTFGGLIDAEGGALTFSDNTLVEGGVENSGANVRVLSGVNVDGNVNQTDGDLSIENGILSGDLIVSGGTVEQDGTITGNLTQSGGTTSVLAGSTVQGATNVTGGSLNVAGGVFTGGLENDGGNIDITGAVTAGIDNNSGRLELNGDAVVTVSYTHLTLPTIYSV